MKAWKYLAVVVALYPVNLMASDFGYYFKFGTGKASVEHPHFTRSVTAGDGSQTTETGIAEKVSSSTLTYGAGVELGRSFSVELGRIDSVRIRINGKKVKSQGEVDFDYLLANTTFNVSDRVSLKLGAGVSRWKTQEMADVGSSITYEKRTPVSGNSPLVRLGADYATFLGKAMSGNLGLYYYYGFDQDYPHQAAQLEYSVYFR
ncbi:Hypothetical protein HDN1F_18340 [gamma proteobacterium HdN1]|nr:Hypothetical protein HDN1F_18340 [gamma proteobacterium HdN1]